MEFQRKFRVSASLTDVVHFHSSASSLAAITPPPIIVQIHHAPTVFEEGGLMDFSLWFGPLPLRWKARIENVSDQGFDDRQISGPYKEWLHNHLFISIDSQTTEIQDTVKLQLKTNPIWWLVGFGMWLGMPALFAFRSWKTRRVLEKLA